MSNFYDITTKFKMGQHKINKNLFYFSITYCRHQQQNLKAFPSPMSFQLTYQGNCNPKWNRI